MVQILLFMFPALLDLVFGATRFVAIQRIGNEPTMSNMAVSMALIMFAVGYLISAKASGHFVSEKNASKFLIGSCSVLGMVSLAFMAFESYMPIYPLMFVFGMSLALFFVPFQVFMRTTADDDGASLAKSTSMYTASWSMGLAMGPFISGWLWETLGWRACYGMCAVVSFGCAIAIAILAAHINRKNVARKTAQAAEAASGLVAVESPYAIMPDMSLPGWICSSAGFLAMLLMLGVLPKYMASLGLSENIKGLILGQPNFAQSLTAMAMIASVRWMYRPGPIVLFGAIGAASLAIFAVSSNALMLMVASTMFGMYAAMYCMCFVFYSLVHPSKSSKYLSINETIVGVMSILGPLVGGVIADRLSHKAAFAISGVCIAIAVSAHAIVLQRRCGHLQTQLAARCESVRA